MYSSKLRRFLAVSAMAFFVGATSVQAQETPPTVIIDSDGDLVPDDADDCPESDISSTVLINGVSTGVRNSTNSMGCTLADLIQEYLEECLEDANNHGQFVSCMSHKMNILKRAKTISGKQKGKIQSIVAKMK